MRNNLLVGTQNDLSEKSANHKGRNRCRRKSLPLHVRRNRRNQHVKYKVAAHSNYEVDFGSVKARLGPGLYIKNPTPADFQDAIMEKIITTSVLPAVPEFEAPIQESLVDLDKLRMLKEKVAAGDLSDFDVSIL
jgi:hypothetical protein